MGLPEATRIRILLLTEKGRTNAEIAEELAVSEATIKRTRARWRELESVHDRPRSGRSTVLTDRQKRYFFQLFRTRQITSPDEAAKFAVGAGLPTVSGHTIAKAMREKGLRPYTMQHKPLLTPAHKAARLEFALARRGMTAALWRRVIFSDETYIYRLGTAPSRYVWCLSDDDFAEWRVTPTAKFGGGSIMVWAAISIHGLSNIVAVQGNLNAAGYLAILKQHLLPLVHRDFPNGDAIFMQDNAACHTAGDVMEWIDGQHFGHMEWPANSPDLNPIEHVWALFKKAVARQPIPANKDALWENIQRAAHDFWSPERTAQIAHMIETMPARLEAVIAANGGVTRY
jgi:transposase